MKPLSIPFFSAALVGAAAFLTASLQTQAQDFTTVVKEVLAATGPTDLATPGKGDPNWFFLRKELQHLQHGDLAKADLAKVNKEGTDAVPVIAKYAEELKALGVELLLVPVPPKAAIYPEKLDAKIDPATVPSIAPFLAKLKAAGVDALNLEAVLKKEKAAHPDKQLYCATDSHWSPYTCQLVAKLVADRYKDQKEIKEYALADLIDLPQETLEFHGDLLTAAQKSSLPKEKLPMVRAGLAVPPDGKQVTTVNKDPQSAMLLLGDSHLLVFRKGGDMLATQGGFVDHLQVDLSAAVDEYAMQAGGADGPRADLARATVKKPDFWAKKKVVVWVFTAREFTEGKWRVIPALVKKK
ncbi:MAG: hypothetical protein ACAI34_16315 [Verrucomicrobium sp.]